MIKRKYFTFKSIVDSNSELGAEGFQSNFSIETSQIRR